MFDGLDTVATVTLNGRETGRTAHMHRGYRFDVRAALRDGRNELAVHFRSALEYAEETEARLGRCEHAYPHPFTIGPQDGLRLRPGLGPRPADRGHLEALRLERWRTARLAGVRPLVTVEGDGTGWVEVHADIERSGAGPARPLVLTATVDGLDREVRASPDETTAVAALRVPDARLWRPAGHGGQPLCDLVVTLHEAGAGADADAGADAGEGTKAGTITAPLYRLARRIGFRTVTLDTVVDDLLVSRPAGATHSVTVRTGVRLDDPTAALTGPLVPRAAGGSGAPASRS